MSKLGVTKSYGEESSRKTTHIEGKTTLHSYSSIFSYEFRVYSEHIRQKLNIAITSLKNPLGACRYGEISFFFLSRFELIHDFFVKY